MLERGAAVATQPRRLDECAAESAVTRVLRDLWDLGPRLLQGPLGTGLTSTGSDQPLHGSGQGSLRVPGLNAVGCRRKRIVPAATIEQAPGEESLDHAGDDPRIELLEERPRLADAALHQLVLAQGGADEHQVDVASNRLECQPCRLGVAKRIRQHRDRFGLTVVPVRQPDADGDVDLDLLEPGGASQLTR